MNSTKYDNELNSAEKLSVEEKEGQEEQEEQGEQGEQEEQDEPVEEKPVEEKPVEEKPVEEKPVEEKKRKKKQRCEHCRVKLGLFTFTCKCSMVLCQKHLSPHNHLCTFDYVKEKKDLIEKNNPKLGEKFIRI
jgi:hypothetical protein